METKIEWRVGKVNPEEVRLALQQVQFTNHDNGFDSVPRELISASRYAIESLQRERDALRELLKNLTDACQRSFDWQYDPDFTKEFDAAWEALNPEYATAKSPQGGPAQ